MRIEVKRAVSVTPDEAWEVVSDPCAIGSLSDAVIVHELEPGSTPGIGTRYRVLLRVGPVPVGGNVEIIEFEKSREMSWTTLTGVDHRLRLRLREHPDGGSWIIIRFAYDTPGVLGSVVDVVSFLTVRATIQELLDEIVERLEAAP
jgi:fatty-acyl-CoA synthase